MGVKELDEQKQDSKNSSNEQSVGNYLLDRLYELGIEHVFGIPGDYVLQMDKLIELHKIKFINTTRENTAGYMADAYARLKGAGAACITYGVGIGITNAISQAYVESSPMIVISGAPGANDFIQGRGLHHLLNKRMTSGEIEGTQLEIFKHITVDQAVLNNPSLAAAQIDRVLNSCLQQKKPVYIEIPRDVVSLPIQLPKEKAKLTVQSDLMALEESLLEISKILKKCQSPVIWAGHEIQRYGLSDSLLEFAEKYRIPIVSSLLGKTVIGEQHPLFVGVYQGAMSSPEVKNFVENCDCILLFGVILTDVQTGIFTAKLNQEMKVIATTEDIAIGHHHYQKISFVDFIKGIEKLQLNLRFRHPFPAKIDALPSHFVPKQGAKMTAARFFECISSHLKPQHIVVTDIGDCLFGSIDFILEQDSFLCCADFGTLGFGTPGAVAAQLACPKKRVIGIIGDGAFQMTSMELSTAVRYQLDPIIIVLNNHGYATERPLLEGNYNDIQDWNYSELPKIFGHGVGVKVTTEEELNSALVQALKQRGVFHLIEVDLEKLDFSPSLQRFVQLVNAHKAAQSKEKRH